MTFHDFLARHVDAVNARDHHAVTGSYEPDGIVVPRPGLPLAGADRDSANRHLMCLGGMMRAALRHAYVVDGLALLLVDWSVRGAGVDLAGTATDVVRRGPDDRWRYVIDNPFGSDPGGR